MKLFHFLPCLFCYDIILARFHDKSRSSGTSAVVTKPTSYKNDELAKINQNCQKEGPYTPHFRVFPTFFANSASKFVGCNLSDEICLADHMDALLIFFGLFHPNPIGIRE